MAVDKSIWPIAYGSDRKGYLVKRITYLARAQRSQLVASLSRYERRATNDARTALHASRTTNNAGEARVATAVAMVLSLFLEGQLAV